MRLLVLTLLGFSAVSKAWASEDSKYTEASSESAGSITTIVPGLNYTVQLDCIGCPFLQDDGNWESNPRSNAILLNFGVKYSFRGSRYGISLNNLSFDPISYERRAPFLMGGSDPFVPPFTAVQVPSDVGSSAIEMQLDDAHQKPFELAYNYNYILYHTPENGREWLTLIEFEITGMRHELHDPKDINFKGDWVQGIRDKMRMLISYDNPKEETTIEVLELMPRDAEKGYVPSEGSIASSSWGGRMPSIAEDLYTMNRSYKPGDWNECGPKNDQWRQNLCGIEDFTEWLKNDVGMDPHVILTLFVVLCIIVGVMLAFALWKFYRLARGQLATWDQRAEESDGEERSGLLAGNEELDEEEKFVSTKAHTSEP